MDWELLLTRAYPAGRRSSIFYSRGEHDDLRLGDLVRTWDRHSEIQGLLEARPQVIIVGAPDDLGITMGRGRPGARHGPEAIRQAFYRLTPGFVDNLAGGIVDIGDLRLPNGTSDEARLRETHLRMEELIHYLSLTGAIIVVLGGGQDLTYSSVMGYTKAQRHLRQRNRQRDGVAAEVVDWFGLINVDKFLDVRDPEISGLNSGTAFFRILEEPDGPVDPANFVAFAIQEQHCSPRHRAYLLTKGATLVNLEQFWLGRENVLNAFDGALNKVQMDSVATMVSFDMNATTLPGVSAPSPLGLQPGTCCAMASMAGERGVGLVEFMETSPPHDDRQQPTSRLAANMLFYFLQGLSQSLSPSSTT
ncbi:MAG: arginase family protein [Vulcanimicrobiota bacterium]